jgi:hypothetical protein
MTAPWPTPVGEFQSSVPLLTLNAETLVPVPKKTRPALSSSGLLE